MAKGRRPLPWIKLWFDLLGDPKMKRLSIAERGCWDGILLLAGQSPIRGKLMLTETQPMSIHDISKALNLTNREISLLKSCISKLTELDSLRWNEHSCLEVIHFKERQEVYPSDIPEKSEITPNSLPITSDKTPTEGERRDAEEDKNSAKAGRKKRPALSKTDKPTTSSVCVGEPVPAVKPDSGTERGQASPAEKQAGESVTPEQAGLKPRTKEPSVVLDIFADMRSFLGYPDRVKQDPIPSYPMEGQAIKRMLTRRFTREEILACWRSKVSQRGGEFVSMKWVNQDIGKRERNDASEREKGGSYEGQTTRVKAQPKHKPEDYRGGFR